MANASATVRINHAPVLTLYATVEPSGWASITLRGGHVCQATAACVTPAGGAPQAAAETADSLHCRSFTTTTAEPRPTT